MELYDFGPPDAEALAEVREVHEQIDPPQSPIYLLSVTPPEEVYFVGN